MRRWARAIRRNLAALWLAARDGRVPLFAQALAVAVVAYVVSPIDLIPDFIPVLGLLDDLVLVPLGIWWVVRLIPGPVMDDLRARATASEPAAATVAGRVAAAAIAALWAAGVAAAGWWLLG